jgi:hypothetical protein
MRCPAELGVLIAPGIELPMQFDAQFYLRGQLAGQRPLDKITQ